jgi:hypothetical protein
MPRFTQSAQAWNTPQFETTFKAELLELERDALPLQQGLRHGSHALPERLEVMFIGAEEAGDCLRVRAGLHYASIIAGCSCADDPTPVDEVPEYCVVEVAIDRHSGEAGVRLLEEEAGAD